jgi:hypothetical protein
MDTIKNEKKAAVGKKVSTPKKKRVGKTLEAARRLKGSIIVYDQSLLHSGDSDIQLSELQGLKNRLIAAIDNTDDIEKLQECMEVMLADTMPCVYTEEEFDQILAESEAGGNAEPEEVKEFFAQWGL